MKLSLRQAAQQTGVSKSTILRAIQNGRLSSTRTDDGGHAIDPAELMRVYPARPMDQANTDATGQDAPADGPAALRAEIEGLRAQLAMMREYTAQQIDELKHQRDAWQEQAQSAQRLLEHQAPRRGWFGLKRAG